VATGSRSHESIGARVRRLRIERGWSERELADRAGLSYQTIRNLESRLHYPQWGTIYGIAHAFDVPVEAISRGLDPEERQDWRAHLASLEQQRLGARWVEERGHFVIDPAGAETDVAAANDGIVRQLHGSVRQKAGSFSEISKRLDNAIGWNGIAAASQRFLGGVQRPTEDIPAHLGSIYSAILELGSFLDQDLKLQAVSSSAADPLDPEVHRALSDLIRTTAPWLRRFPTVRELDDESGAFLTDKNLLNPGADLIQIARDRNLVSRLDADAIMGLLNAARRGEFQGQKANTRSVFSIRNLVFVSASLLATFLSGALASNFSEKSLLISHAGTFLAVAEARIMEFAGDLPDDIRIALQQLIKEIKEHPELTNKLP
jgi:transcriptional regulator with XRE-family HTH domain